MDGRMRHQKERYSVREKNSLDREMEGSEMK